VLVGIVRWFSQEDLLGVSLEDFQGFKGSE